MCPHNCVQKDMGQMRDKNVCSCRIKPGLAVDSQQAAATLLLQQGRLHYSQAQQHAAGGAVSASAEAAQAAMVCFKEAATCVQSFGEGCSHLYSQVFVERSCFESYDYLLNPTHPASRLGPHVYSPSMGAVLCYHYAPLSECADASLEVNFSIQTCSR